MNITEGDVAAITGAGSGIGRALALQCAGRGMDVALADIDPERLSATAEMVESKGRRAFASTVDVTDRQQVEAFAAATLAQFGNCRLLFNNAGVLMLGDVENATAQDWRWVLDINLYGTIHGVDAFLPHFIARGDGHIVNTVSLRGIVAGLSSAVYCTSKFAVLGLTEALRIDLADKGIGVTAICPWAVRTELMEHQEQRPNGVTRIAPEYVEALKNSSKAAETDIWIEPSQVAALALEAVEANDPYVITHPCSRSLIVERYEAMLASLDRLAQRHPELP